MDQPSERWEVVVVGAGPAGSVAARQLALQGCRVLLLDKAAFPREKVCGGCLASGGVRLLESLNLSTILTRTKALPLKRVQVHVGHSRGEWPMHGGVSVSRFALDHALNQAAVEAGATFLQSTTVTEISLTDEARILTVRQGEKTRTIEAAMVVLAAGLGTKLADTEPGMRTRVMFGSHLGLQARLAGCEHLVAPGCLQMHVGRGGYAGVVQLEDGTVNIAAALSPEWMRQAGTPDAALEPILRDADLLQAVRQSHAAWHGTPQLTRRAIRVAGPRLMLVGDAAGYVEPFTGEGMLWAMAGAAALTPLAASGAKRWRDELADQWQIRHDELLWVRKLRCRAIAAILRQSPLTSAIVRVGASLPALGEWAVKLLHAPAGLQGSLP